MRGSRVLLVLLAAAALANLAFAGARRIAYPYDLEWMEGGVLCHALRLVHGEPIYAEPSARFVSFAYTPLYPAVLWALSPVFGLGYLPARSVSVAAFAWALVVAYLFVRREGGSRAVALGAAALPAAAFAPTGAWYDLVRVDSLFLGLLASAVAVGWWTRNGARGPVAAGALMTAAFFAKQTALPFAVVLGLVLLVSRRRAAAVYAATVVMLGAALLAWLHAASGGWFWTYAFALHRRHPFEVAAAALVTPARLALLLAPGLLLLAWALARAPRTGLLYASALAVTGVVAAALGAGTTTRSSPASTSSRWRSGWPPPSSKAGRPRRSCSPPRSRPRPAALSRSPSASCPSDRRRAWPCRWATTCAASFPRPPTGPAAPRWWPDSPPRRGRSSSPTTASIRTWPARTPASTR